MGEVEAHAFGVDQLALLRHVRAQHMAQRRVHQVGGGMVGAGAQAPLRIDAEQDGLAGAKPALRQLQGMDMQIAGQLLGVEHLGPAAGGVEIVVGRR